MPEQFGFWNYRKNLPRSISVDTPTFNFYSYVVHMIYVQFVNLHPHQDVQSVKHGKKKPPIALTCAS